MDSGVQTQFITLSKCLCSLSHLLVLGGGCFVLLVFIIIKRIINHFQVYSSVVLILIVMSLLVSFPCILLLVHTDCIPVKPALPLLMLVTILLSMISPRKLLVDLCFIIS